MGLKVYTAKEWSEAMGFSNPSQATQSHDATEDRIKRLLRHNPLMATRWFGLMAGEVMCESRDQLPARLAALEGRGR